MEMNFWLAVIVWSIGPRVQRTIMMTRRKEREKDWASRIFDVDEFHIMYIRIIYIIYILELDTRLYAKHPYIILWITIFVYKDIVMYCSCYWYRIIYEVYNNIAMKRLKKNTCAHYQFCERKNIKKKYNHLSSNNRFSKF